MDNARYRRWERTIEDLHKKCDEDEMVAGGWDMQMNLVTAEINLINGMVHATWPIDHKERGAGDVRLMTLCYKLYRLRENIVLTLAQK
ncbi:hypothetical protein [Hufsiella ginkgonis]|uniref:Uncharacterized protein n=1 Tax=Hufsiella ginkgonis TaxID=2695274 RepID=A0A7K1Y185_9SPHI|nr:hypothetical protein [Hufsiella ginkgonis]MXV16877.1 hypothetical protein [Hufsiella ginkgonis]